MQVEEDNFPRGGKRVTRQKREFPKDDNLFPANEPVKAKKTRKEKPDKVETGKKGTSEDIFNIIQVDGSLSYKKIQEGMVILSCLRKIKECTLEIEFPGLTFGQVNITNISHPLNSILSSNLQENNIETYDILQKLYKVGQYLPAKIIQVTETDRDWQIKASLNPSDINFEKKHASFLKGQLIWAAVETKLDHGYQLTAGIKDCRIFLPNELIDDTPSGKKEYTPGETLWCVITKVATASAASNLRVSAKQQHVTNVQVNMEDLTLHDIMPGSKVEFIPEKILKNGVQGKFMDTFFAYLDETQLKTPMQKLTDIKEFKVYHAYVLYTELSTQITHLSLRGIETSPAPKYDKFALVSGQVFSKAPKGVFLKFSQNDKGFVPNHRLMDKNHKVSDLKSKITDKYPIGSKHQCRILDYNHMERIYTCTVETKLLKEKYLCAQNFKVGELVEGTVAKVLARGVVLQVGQVKGFVPNLHLSDVQFSENIKKKYALGKKFKARVLKIDDENVLFTLKPSIVKNENCLHSLEQAKPDSVFPAIIVKIVPKMAIVTFYGSMSGKIYKKELNIEKESDSIGQYYYVGQVLNVRIKGVQKENLILTLKSQNEKEKKQPKAPKPITTPAKPTREITVGEYLSGTFSKISDTGLEISIGTKKAFLPLNHISIIPTLCRKLLDTFKVNETIRNLICIESNKNRVVVSRREALGYQRLNMNILRLEKLKFGALIRCTVTKITNEGVSVSTPLIGHVKNILVPIKETKEPNETMPSFQIGQSLVAKITSVNYKTKAMSLSLKVGDVFDGDVESVVKYFSEFLQEEELLRQAGIENNWEITQFKIGKRVDVSVVEVNPGNGCSVLLPNGSKGLVAQHLCPKKLKVGAKMQGVILGYNFTENHLDISLDKKVNDQINENQGDCIVIDQQNKQYFAQKVLVKKEYVLAVLNESGNRQLVYLPVSLHENDFSLTEDYYNDDNKIKVVICGSFHGSKLIGMHKKLKLTLDKQFNARQQKEAAAETKKIEAKKATISARKNSKEDSDSGVNDDTSGAEDNFENDINEPNNNDEESSETSDNEEPAKITDNEENIEDSDEDVNNEGNETIHSIHDTSSEMALTIADSDSETFKQTKEVASKHNIISTKALVPGLSTFFTANVEQKQDDSSSSDEESAIENPRKKKKLSSAERAAKTQLEEEHLREIENDLADPKHDPKSAEHFDRLLLANPDSSELWLKYTSFHISATELEKARSVMKRALESINMTKIQEKYNIWTARLNFENLYGNKESFDEVFEEAVKFNDALKIYLQAIDILGGSSKVVEMEEKIKKARNKFKQSPLMWLSVARMYYKTNNFREARNIKAAAFKSITNAKTQMDMLVKFALLEFKEGEPDAGAAIFETILQSDPRKINIWMTYHDQLVKQGNFDQARIVLTNATSHKLPVRSLKTLFNKFRIFEEAHGTPETLEALKKRVELIAK